MSALRIGGPTGLGGAGGGGGSAAAAGSGLAGAGVSVSIFCRAPGIRANSSAAPTRFSSS